MCQLNFWEDYVRFKYECVVQTVDDEDRNIVVMGLKKKKMMILGQFSIDGKNISIISVDIIQAILPSPKFIMKKKKVIYQFPGFVSVNEKQVLK